MAKHLFIILVILIASPAFAEEKGPWWKFWPSEEQQTVVEETTAVIENHLFTEDERSILNDFLRKGEENKRYEETDGDDKHGKKDKKAKKQKALPAGLKKKVELGGELPPGWQKKVARGEVLDNDLYLTSKGLPQDVLDQLPNSPDGTIIRQIDDTIVRVRETTNVILDVLKGNAK
jgi:hypothetical protein